MAENEKQVRTSRIIKSIERTYNVAAYESLTIRVSQEDDITWQTLEERDKKLAALTRLVTKDFEETKAKVFAEFAATEKKAYYKNAAVESEPSTSLDGLE